MNKHDVQLSKFLSYLLRHAADQNGLCLDEQGFAPLEQVWSRVEKKYRNKFTEKDLETVLKGDKRGKKRFELIDGKIRAMYGHNRHLKQEIQYQEAEPPAFLYHGTTPSAYEQIMETGLKAMQRQYVHLAIKTQLAYTVASRYTKKPIMIRVHAKAAFEHGVLFYHPEASHYLCPFVPPDFISLAPPDAQKESKKG